MARGRFIYDPELKRCIPAHEYHARKAAQTPDRSSSLPSPMVIGAMPETRSPIDGRIYTDKSSYYRHVERNNCAIVGYDKNWTDYVDKAAAYNERAHRDDIIKDVKKSIEQVASHGGVPNAV